MSPETTALKLALYRKDFLRFAQEQLKIRPKFPVGSPPVPFGLNPPQQRLNGIAEEQLATMGRIRLCILKARQPGVSTWAEGRVFHLASINPNISGLTVAHDDPTAAHLFSIQRLFYEGMDPTFQPMVRYQTKTYLDFANPSAVGRRTSPGLRSRVTCDTAKNVHSGTGHTLQALHLSECSKFAYPESLWSSLAPTVPDVPGTVIIFESTAHTSGAWFREFCEQSQRGLNSFRFVFLPWYWSPEYSLEAPKGVKLSLSAEEKYWKKHFGLSEAQIRWYRMKIQDAGGDTVARELVRQEYPFDPEEAWISLTLSVFEPRRLQELHRQVRPPKRLANIFPGTPPRVLDTAQGQLAIWEAPLAGEQYDIGADVAAGVEGGDWSVACVVKRRNREQVAEWRGRLDPFSFAQVLYDLGHYYCTAQVGVEIEGIGFAANDALLKLGYPYVYVWRYRGDTVPKLSQHAGWKTTHESKRFMITLARHHMQHGALLVHSPILWQEMRTFALTGLDTYGATAGAFDDCVMAWMIALVIGDDERAEAWAAPEPAAVQRAQWRDPALHDPFDEQGPETLGALDSLIGQLRG